MPDPWHGINDPGYWIKPQAAPSDNTRVAVTDSDTKPKEKAGPVATLSDAKFVPPQAGVKFNDKCPVQVSVKYKEKSSQTRVTFKLFCNYNSKKQDLNKKVDANESNGIAKAELQLFYPEGYETGSVEYFFTAEHCRGDKVVESDKLALPSKKSLEVTIKYSDNANKIPTKAEDILKEILKEATIDSVILTSTTRSPADQARIMYSNLETYGVDQQKELYAASGDEVIDVYASLKKAGKTPDEIKSGMEQKIIAIGPQKVSAHCADTSKKCVFDVAPSSVPADKKLKFEDAVNKNSNVKKFLKPPGDPAFHIEIDL
jgi:hypothetical protein